MTVARGVLDRAAGALRPAVLERKLDGLRHRLEGASKLLDAVNPDNLLQRGYVRVGAKVTGKVIASAADARAAGALTLQFGDGTVDARVERGSGKAYADDKPEQPGLF